MKRIILSTLALMTSLAISAQTIKIYEYDDDGNLSSTPAYTNTNKVKVVFKETIPDYKDQKLEAGSKVEGKVIVEGETYTKAIGGTVADYVDLGTRTSDGKRVLWATHNLGATKPEEYGAYIAWGENGTKEEGYSNGIKPKGYYLSNLKYCNGEWNSYSKYVVENDYGTVDGKYTLEPEDDAATVNWGKGWRTPTFKELIGLGGGTWFESGNTEFNGVAGYKIEWKGNSIFLPAAGHTGDIYTVGSYGKYWTSNLGGRMEDTYNESPTPFELDFYSTIFSYLMNGRNIGNTIRPVYVEE